MMRCTTCRGIDLRVIRSIVTMAGHRRRRWQCNNCQHRWTTFQEHAQQPRERRKPRPRLIGVRTLTNADAASIMLSPASARELAAQYGITRQAICHIKRGQNYRDVHAALGLNRKGCEECRFWDKGCTFSFPEAGGSFSQHCSLYEPNVC